MFEKASADQYPAVDFYRLQFISLMHNINECYKVLVENERHVFNDENAIRDILLSNYLNNVEFRTRFNLDCFIFDAESQENYSGYVDIKIQDYDTFKTPTSYYIIECKRLDNRGLNTKSGLNGKYVENGIVRFVRHDYYSTPRGINGMIGFLVERMDAGANIKLINSIAQKHFSTTANIVQEIQQHDNVLFASVHERMDGKHITLFHLMLDLSDIIE